MVLSLKQLCRLGGSICVAWQLACTVGLPTKELSGGDRAVDRAPEVGVAGIEKLGDIPAQDDRCPDGLQFVSVNDGWFFCRGHLWQTSDGGKSWQNVYTADHIEGSSVFFEFISAQVGWSSSMNALQKSEDGGRTWRQIPSPIDGMNGEISSVKFLKDGKRGWLTGGLYYPLIPGAQENEGLKHVYQNMGKAPRAAIFYTDDGGLTWHRQFLSPYLGSFIHYVYVSNDQQIWAIGDTHLYHLEENIWKVVDFEKANCVKRNLLETLGLDQSRHDIYEITAFYIDGSMYGWLAFSNGYLARTIDGGETWCDLVPPKAILSKPDGLTAFIRVHFTDSRNGWALSSSGALYETRDGGGSWKSITTTTRFSAMCFLGPNRGWVAGKEGIFRINI